MKKRICLITPAHVAFNPRLVKEADALSSAGYAVHVIAGNNLDNMRPMDEPILKAANWTFELVGGGRLVGDFMRRARTRLAKELVERLRSENLRLSEWACHTLTDFLRIAASRYQAELYVAHNVGALPAAYWAAKRFSSMWGFDAEDYHLGEFEKDELGGAAARAVRKIEAVYLPHARHFTAASEGIAAAYARDFEIPPPQVILNVFPRRNAPSGPTRAGQVRPGPSVYWFSQTVGRNRGLECAVMAIAQAKSQPHLYLRGNLQAGFKRRLSDIAGPLGILDRLHYLPVAFGADMERLASDYDIGLVGETGYTENRQKALTNKLFSFLLAGVPVVASNIAAHRSFAKACSAVHLYSVESPSSLAKVIDDLLTDPQTLENARYQSWAAAQQRYNWNFEQTTFLRSIRDEIGPPEQET